MRRAAGSLIVGVLALALMLNLIAASLAGVTLPDTVQVGSTTLLLNGLGLRTKFMVKVYVAGLYLAQKSSDAGLVLRADAPKQIVMHFVHSASKNQMCDAFNESFSDNSPDARKAMQAEIDRFFAVISPVKDGDELVFTYIPGTGTTFAVNGTERLRIAGSAFAEMLFSVWLGPKPPNATLKKGLLGQ